MPPSHRKEKMMSDKMRWRRDTNPVVAAVDSATVIEIGDLVWQDVDDAKPASDCALSYQSADRMIHTKDSEVGLLQERFAKDFLGVAMQRSDWGQTAPVRVATTGVFEFDCPRGTFELGDLMGIDENAGMTALATQQVAKVTASKHAIGRVAKREGTPVTSVLVDIRSRVMGISV